MPTLHELQSRIRDAIFDDIPVMLQDQIQQNTITTSTGLGIYRNNVFTNLREALRTMFPVINKLVGDDFFRYAAIEYIHNHPSPAGDLNQYGESFADFLAGFTPARELVYLPDVARLEWIAHRAYHAEDVPALNRQRLELIPPHAYADLKFILNPACALLESDYPIHRIWHINQSGYAGEDKVDLQEGSVRLLIQRRHGLIELEPLDRGNWIFLSTLSHGNDFATACSKAMQADLSFNLKHCMNRLIMESVLVDIEYNGKLISEY